jgi:hypothetical protein
MNMAMRNKDFAVFILTYGRADKVITVDALRKRGYTGKIYFVCSTDDEQLGNYKKKYGDDVIVFDKNDVKGTFDIGDNFKKDNVVVYARNINHKIAGDLGLKWFLQLDDDYMEFQYKMRDDKKLNAKPVKDLDSIFDLYLDFLENTPVTSIAFAQAGDFIGGKDNIFFKKGFVGRKRKLMNCFFNRVDRPYQFLGRINEDVNCYVQNGKTGTIFLTHPLVSVSQPITQTNSGGLTEFYLDGGTYVKSFYTLLFNPGTVSVKMMGTSHRRLHHSVKWSNSVPVIIREEYKK